MTARSVVDTVFWIAKHAADGVIRGGVDDPDDPMAWTCRLILSGWEQIDMTSAPPTGPEDAREALGELEYIARHAHLLHSDSDLPPWPDAPGPWRLEMTLRALQAPQE